MEIEIPQGAEVVAFPGVTLDRDFPLAMKPLDRYAPDRCRHEHTTIDPEAHTLACSDCSQQLDPWEVLAKLAREWERLTSRFAEAQKQLPAALARIENLKAEEKRAKARIRNAEKATPADVLIADLSRELYRARQEGFPHRSRDEVAWAAYRERMDRAREALDRAFERDAAAGAQELTA